MISSTLISICSFILIILFLIFSETYIPETKSSLFFFFNNVFPVIFPFYVLSSIIINGNVLHGILKPFDKLFIKIFKMPSCSIAAILSGILFGYPTGAKICTDLKNSKKITSVDASLLSAFTNNISPIFAILVVGKVYLNNPFQGLYIWLCINIVSIVYGIIICKIVNKNRNHVHDTDLIFNNHHLDLSRSIINGLNTSLFVGAVIIFFSSLNALIKLLPFISEFHKSIFHSFIELTGGFINLNKFLPNTYLKNLLLCFFSGWAGIASILQVACILKTNNISIKYYLLLKFLQPLLSSLLYIIFI